MSFNGFCWVAAMGSPSNVKPSRVISPFVIDRLPHVDQHKQLCMENEAAGLFIVAGRAITHVQSGLGPRLQLLYLAAIHKIDY